MARKVQAQEFSKPVPATIDPRAYRQPAPEIEAAVRVLAARFGVDAALSPKERALAIKARIARTPKPARRECHWDVLRGHLRGERDSIAAVFAADALGLGIKEALRRAADGWTAEGPPRSERVPGEDDE